jgi:hypothetical protein
MSDMSNEVTRAEVVALAARIRELETQIVRIPGGAAEAGTNNCTQCSTDGCTDCGTGQCTTCAGDEFLRVILPGELERLSGGELVKRLQSGRSSG